MQNSQLSPLETAPASNARRGVGRGLGVAAIVLVVGLIWLNWGQIQPSKEESAAATIPVAAEVGALAPDFSLPTLDGQTVRLSDYRGKPVILNFWATWCPPCRAEMPALETIWQQNGRGDVVVLGVDQGEQAAVVERFLREEVAISFPILMDRQKTTGDAYLVRSLPTTFFIDPNGFIQEIRVGGPLSVDYLRDRVRRFLGEG